MRRIAVPLTLLVLCCVVLAAKNRHLLNIPVGPQQIVAVVVEETGARSQLPQAQLTALTSMRMPAWAEGKNSRWLIVDKDVQGPDGKPPVELAAILNRVGDRPLPYLIIASASGNVLYEGALPGEEETLRLLKRYGGE